MSNWIMPDGTYVSNPIGSEIVYGNEDIRNYTKPKKFTYEEALEIWKMAKGYSSDPNSISGDCKSYYY